MGGEMSELPASHGPLVGSQGSITPHVQSLPTQCEGFSTPQVQLPQAQSPPKQCQGSSTLQVQSPPKQCETSSTPQVKSRPKQCEGFSTPQVQLPEAQSPQGFEKQHGTGQSLNFSWHLFRKNFGKQAMNLLKVTSFPIASTGK